MATLQEQLDAANTAYSALMTGTMARVIVDQNGERVEFVAANASRLFAWIQTLQAQIAAAANQSGCTPNPLHPMQFTFP